MYTYIFNKRLISKEAKIYLIRFNTYYLSISWKMWNRKILYFPSVPLIYSSHPRLWSALYSAVTKISISNILL